MSYFPRYKKFWITAILIALPVSVFLLYQYVVKPRFEQRVHVVNDLAKIRESKVLNAVVDYNSTNYFIYRGNPMGFQFELLKKLSEDLGVTLEIYVSNNLEESFAGLKNGTYDIIAKNLTVTRPRRSEVDFTLPLMHTRQVLVQRKKRPVAIDTVYIAGTSKLAGKTVHVQKNSAYFRRLINLSKEIGGSITIVEDTLFGAEQLIEKVSKGEIDYTVCDENVAHLNSSYYSNIDVSLRLSFPQNIAWAVRKGSSGWKEYLNNWISEYKTTRDYQRLYHKYFESPRVAQRMGSDYHSIYGGKISPYDDVIRKVSEEHHWDWRLIASVIYHESRFNSDAGSWAGASGLMQIMPATAEAFGIQDYTNPKENIKAGILFLNWLDERFLTSVPDSLERLNFVLAAYNCGLGHVNDAQRLAEKYGKNPAVWKGNVDEFLKNKSIEKFYNDSVVQWGYCRGQEATDFVEKVNANYRHYANLISK